MTLHMLTTVDNPYNPFTQFDQWNAYDMGAGYHTLGFLARVAYTSPDLGQPDQDEAIELAIEEIVRENVLGIYKKVPEPVDN